MSKFYLDNFFVDLKQENMAKSFDSDVNLNASAAGGNQQQFVLREDDRLKQEEEYRQGNEFSYIKNQ